MVTIKHWHIGYLRVITYFGRMDKKFRSSGFHFFGRPVSVYGPHLSLTALRRSCKSSFLWKFSTLDICEIFQNNHESSACNEKSLRSITRTVFKFRILRIILPVYVDFANIVLFFLLFHQKCLISFATGH